ncbi:MAG: hypothetical protein ACXVB1_00315 [Pseudobdellovibrionaceae bacterium]
MSQHSFSIANESGASFRADVNNALQALASCSSGIAEPTTKYAYQFWIDTSGSYPILKQRSSDNLSWITIGRTDVANLGLLALTGGTLTGDLIIQALLRTEQQVDSTTTGASQTLAPTKSVLKVTNASLTSVNMMSGPQNGAIVVLINGTGSTITIKNLNGGTAANQIKTGTGADLNVASGAAIIMIYDSNGTKWQVVGGSGGSSNSITDFITLASSGALTISAIAGLQSFRVQGNSGAITMSTTPFGTTPPPDGGIIYLIGNHDTNTVEVPVNDAANGCLMDGNVVLAKGQTAGFMYSSSLARYVRL